MDESTLRLTFPAAIAYLRNKIPLPSKSWKTYSGQLQDVAFTISQITSATLLADIQALVIKQLETGITIEGFRRDFDALLDKTGYNLANRGYRSELIIQQNVRTAHSRGRWEQMKQTRDRRPYGIWRHADSPVPRPHHLAQDGKVYSLDADAFKAIQPPPWGCRCKVFALSDADLDRMGLTVSNPPPLKEIAEPGFDQGFSELPKERDRLLKEAKKRLTKEFGDLL